MIKIRRNCKEIEGMSFGAIKSVKTGEKQWSARFHSLKEASTKSALCCETISQPQQVRYKIAISLRNRYFVAKSFRSLRPLFAKIFAAAKHPLGTRVPLRSTVTLISQLRNGCEMPKCKNSQFSQPKPHSAGSFVTAKPPFGTRVPFQSLVHSFRNCEMAAKPPHLKILQCAHHE